MAEDTINLPRSEYEALLADREDLRDLMDANLIVHSGDETFPAAVADRLISGDAPLTVFREYRGLSKVALSKASGVNRVQISDIEAGRSTGSVSTLAKLARALGLIIDDLIA